LKTDRFAESLKGFTSGTDVMTGLKQDLSSSIVLPKETTLILELK
jgi:hypothetical protein